MEAIGYREDGTLTMVESSGRISQWRDGRRSSATALGASVDVAAFDHGLERAAVHHAPSTFAMWHVESGRRLWSIEEPTLDGLRVEIQFDPTGKVVVAVSDHDDQRKVALRDAATGAVVGELVVGRHKISAVAFSPDGKRVAAASSNGAVVVWRMPELTQIHAWTADPEPDRMTFLGSDRLVIDSSNAPNRTVSIWELGSRPSLVSLLPPHRGAAVTLTAAPDASALLTSDTNSLRLWSRDGEPLAQLGSTTGFETLVFTPDAVLGAAFDSNLFVLERNTLAPRAVVPAHNGATETVASDRATTRIATVGASDQRVREWSVPRGPTLFRIPSPVVAWTGDRLVAARPGGVDWYRADGTRDGTLDLSIGTVYSIVAAAGRLVVVGSQADIIDSDRTPHVLAEPVMLTVSHDGRYALAIDHDDEPPTDGLRIWDLAKREVVRTLPITTGGAVIVDDTVVVSRNGRIAIYEIATGKQVANARLADREEVELLLSPSGKVLLGFHETTISILDRKTGVVTAKLTCPSDIRAITVSPDDRLLIADSVTGTWAWELATSERALADRRTGDAFAISPHGLIAIGDRGQLRLSSRAGRQLDAIDVVLEPIQRVEFDPTGSRLAISTKASTVILDVHLETRAPQPIAELAKLLPWKIEQGVAVPQ